MTTKEDLRYSADDEIELALYAPVFDADRRRRLTAKGFVCRDIADLEGYHEEASKRDRARARKWRA